MPFVLTIKSYRSYKHFLACNAVSCAVLSVFSNLVGEASGGITVAQLLREAALRDKQRELRTAQQEDTDTDTDTGIQMNRMMHASCSVEIRLKF